jgi:hypothetical protein
MSSARGALATVLALVGVVWIGQGIGVIPGSFMTSDIRWAVAGAVLLAVAFAVVWSGRRSP